MRIDPDAVAALRADRDGPVCAYVYDLDGLRAHAAAAVAALPEGCELFYALKANSERPVIEALVGTVAGFEVGSAGEIELVRALDPDAPIVFGGPGKTDAALAAAARQRVAAVHVESLHELRRAEHVAAALGVTLPVALRVNLAGPLPVSTLAMAGQPTQFGMAEGDVPDALDLARHGSHLEFVGFHFHCLSNHHDAPAHARLVAPLPGTGGPVGRRRRSAARCRQRRRRHRRRLRRARPALRLDRLLRRPRRGARRRSGPGARPGPVRVRPVPRRAVGRLRLRGARREDQPRPLLRRGAGRHTPLPAAGLVGPQPPVHRVPVEEWRYPFPRPGVRRAPVTVAGELCSPKDVLARDVVVDELRAGDLLWFHHAGAYGWSISHHDFLNHPHPRRLFRGAAPAGPVSFRNGDVAEGHRDFAGSARLVETEGDSAGALRLGE